MPMRSSVRMRRAVERLHRHHVEADRIGQGARRCLIHSLRLDVLPQTQLAVVPFPLELIEEGARDSAALAMHLFDHWRSVHARVDNHHLVSTGFHQSRRANLLARAAYSSKGEIGVMVFVSQLPPTLLFDTGDLRGRKVLLAGGRRDPIVRPEETERLAKLLESYGAQVSLHWSNQGHELNAAELDEAGAWLTRI